MNRNTFIAFGLLLALLAAGVPAQAQPAQSAQQLQLNAYSATVAGDRAKGNNDLVAAFEAYERSYNLYKELSESHPDWQKDIVQYRLTYCRDQMDALRPQIASAPASAAKPAPAPAEKAPAKAPAPAARAAAAPSAQSVDFYRTKYSELLEQNEDLREQIDSLQAQINSAPVPVADDGAKWRAQHEAVSAQNKELQKRIAQLEQDVRAKSSVSAGGDQQLRQKILALTDDNQKIQEKLAEAHAEMSALRGSMLGEEQLNMKVTDLDAQLQARGRDVDALKQENQMIRNDLAAVQSERDGLAGQIEEVNAKWRANLTKVANELKKVRGDAGMLEVELRKTEARARAAEDQLNQAQQAATAIPALESKVAVAEDLLRKADADIKKLVTEKDQLSARLADMERVEKEAQARSAQALADAEKREKEALSRSARALSEEQKKADELKSQISDLTAQLAKKDKELQKQAEDLSMRQKKFEASAQSEYARKEKDLLARVKAAEDQLNQAQQAATAIPA
ncbi:MAG TPA: hypothetical protein PKM67_10480, partial [Kiritimatiellia bacterium]|nr:hypothetical protein [Kiritimatiellia bacterium]